MRPYKVSSFYKLGNKSFSNSIKFLAMESIGKGWFSEVSSFWPGQAQSLEVEEVLFKGKSDFQDLLVFKSKSWGNVLVLDGAIQFCDKDEFSYHENIAHIPMFSHPNPKRVLIIGGGDGGVMREVLKHPSVEEVVLCDIDKMVTDVSKQFFPVISCSFADPRAKVLHDDGCKFVREEKSSFDVVIVDSSDPDGPASTLFTKEFFTHCRERLTEGGILCTQAENMWLHLELISSMHAFISEVGFPSVEYCAIQTPSYPEGSIGFWVCSNKSCSTPVREIPASILDTLKYYDSDMHKAAFAIPRFAKLKLGKK